MTIVPFWTVPAGTTTSTFKQPWHYSS